MCLRCPLPALLYLLVWVHHVSGLPEEIVFPERVASRVRRNAGHNNTEHFDENENVSYNIHTTNGTIIINLQRNRGFVSENFQHFTYSKDGGLRALKRTLPKHVCYYHGHVEGMENSVVALSTCHGLRGVMYLSDVHYGIEPEENSLHGEHRLYKIEDNNEPSMCGVGDFTRTMHSSLPSYYHLRRRKRDVLVTTSYVEFGVVVDNLRYVLDNKNLTTVEVETIQLVNIVDGMFKSLNIRVVLTNLVTWSDGNPIDVTSGTAGDVLGRFSQWRSSATNLTRCDAYHLLIGHGAFSGGVLGMAFVGTVCSPSVGDSISTFSSGATPSSQASVVAHELGHNLGMGHDDSRCPGSYIMHSADIGATTFSNCSASDFETLILNGGGTCLRNPPDPNQVYSIPVCGNNIVESGEECDCGSPQQCNSPCCNAATCKLTSGSQCAQGLCCEGCRFKVGGTMCRPIANACDLPEYCNGSYALCPVDVYIMNGYPCNNSRSYCYAGVCQNYDAQCQALFGSGARKANDVCFQSVNMNGDKYGNCGTVSGVYQKCSIANSLCGTIQCTGTFTGSSTYSTIISTVNGQNCMSAAFNLGPDVPDPSLVHQGTGCDQGKACVNYQCVNASNLGFNCDIKGKCNDHGVCNNKGNCYCDNGWAPPFCDRSGYGGSIDSGPTHIDTSLRDGLLVFFLLVVPILILIIVLWIKRDAVRRRFCRKKRRQRGGNTQTQVQNTTGNRSAAANRPSNQNTNFSDVFTISHHFPSRQPLPGTRPQPPLRPPPPRPPTTPQYNW